MKSLLENTCNLTLKTKPYPYLVIKNALPQDLYQNLTAQFPSIDTLSSNQELGSNKRLDMASTAVQTSPDITPLWKEFIALHTSQKFFDQLISVFSPAVMAAYPHLFQRKDRLVTGVRHENTYATCDVMMDALISANTPVLTTPTSVRKGHLDLPNKLFSGLFYLRDPQDNSDGGNFEIYRFRTQKPYGFKSDLSIHDDYLALVETVPYRSNTLVVFMNSIASLHGVSVRSLTSYARRFVNLVVEVEHPLFASSPYQEAANPWIRKVKQKIVKLAS